MIVGAFGVPMSFASLSGVISRIDGMARPPLVRVQGRDTSAVASWGDRNPMRGKLPQTCRLSSLGQQFATVAFLRLPDTLKPLRSSALVETLVSAQTRSVLSF